MTYFWHICHKHVADKPNYTESITLNLKALIVLHNFIVAEIEIRSSDSNRLTLTERKWCFLGPINMVSGTQDNPPVQAT